MAIRPIVKWGDPVLHSPARAVLDINGTISDLIRDMVDTMYGAPGIGLAAPQIGVPLRVVVIDLSVGERPGELVSLINPVIVERSGDQQHEEGCLSIPGFEGTPVRPASVTLKGILLDGSEKVFTGTSLLARAFSHEMDHLEGLLFVDRLSPLKRDLMKRRLRRRFRRVDRRD
jgi:peptide deformylase